MEEIVSITVNKDLVNLYLKNRLSNEFLKKLIIIMDGKNNPSIFKHENTIPWDYNIEFNWSESLFPKSELDADKNSLEEEDIIEKAAIGLILGYFMRKLPNISNIKVCFRGEGYDYKFRNNNSRIKLEISGVCKKRVNTFNQRIYTKKRKFHNNKYEPRADVELIGITDFYYLRYIVLEVK